MSFMGENRHEIQEAVWNEPARCIDREEAEQIVQLQWVDVVAKRISNDFSRACCVKEACDNAVQQNDAANSMDSNLDDLRSPSVVEESELQDDDRVDSIIDEDVWSAWKCQHSLDSIIDEDVWSAWKCQHSQAEQFRPNIEAVIQMSILRDQIVSLLMSCLDSRCIGAPVVHQAVCMLDRFLAASASNPTGICYLSAVFATMYIAAKMMACVEDNTLLYLRSIVAHYGNGRLTTHDIHRAEVVILNTLEGRVRTTTPLDFLELYMMVLTQTVDPAIVPIVKDHSTHILTLALKDAKLYHSIPYIDLAAGAVYAALHVMAPAQYGNPIFFSKILQEITAKGAGC